MCKFGILILGESGKILSKSVRPTVSGLAHRNLSPTWEYYLGTVMRAVRA